MTIQETIADEFNEFSKNYTEDMVRCVPYYLELLESFKISLPQSFHPKNILDLGCGNGNVTHTLAQLFPEAHYTLIDASQDMLDLCKQRFKSNNINYHNVYFNDFSFKEAGYDLVVAGFSLHHCDTEEKKNIYKKIYHGLKNGGIFACSDLMIDKSEKAHQALLNYWEAYVSKSFPDGKKWSWLKEHYQEFDKPESITKHVQLLKEAGFKYYNFNMNDHYWGHFKATK
jgi:ubiquinone/menaquinone biosynthesis C-methylase UbiE